MIPFQRNIKIIFVLIFIALSCSSIKNNEMIDVSIFKRFSCDEKYINGYLIQAYLANHDQMRINIANVYVVTPYNTKDTLIVFDLKGMYADTTICSSCKDYKIMKCDNLAYDNIKVPFSFVKSKFFLKKYNVIFGELRLIIDS